MQRAFRRAVALFDLHETNGEGPSKKFERAALEFLDDVRPDKLLLVGDVADLESVSMHGNNPDRVKLKKELKPVRHKLDLYKAAARAKQMLYFEGNHEDRLRRYIVANAPMLDGLISLPDLLGLEERGIEWIPTEQQPYAEGSTLIVHGHQMRSPGQYPARKLVEIWGQPGKTVMCGHFHRTEIIRKIMHPKNAIGIVVGCGRTEDPRWAVPPTGWSHALAVIDTMANNTSKVTVVDANDGLIVWGNKTYGS